MRCGALQSGFERLRHAGFAAARLSAASQAGGYFGESSGGGTIVPDVVTDMGIQTPAFRAARQLRLRRTRITPSCLGPARQQRPKRPNTKVNVKNPLARRQLGQIGLGARAGKVRPRSSKFVQDRHRSEGVPGAVMQRRLCPLQDLRSRHGGARALGHRNDQGAPGGWVSSVAQRVKTAAEDGCLQ